MKHRVGKFLIRMLLIQVGAVLAAAGLEIFLVPNQILDGGVVGLSIIATQLTKLPLGLFIVVLNLPFIALSFRLIGRRFVALTIYAVVSLSVWVTLLHPVPEISKNLFLVTIFGGIVLGIGVGLIIRNGACLDGAEIVAIILNRRLPFSVGEIILFINILVFGAAALVFSLDAALYSIVAYLIAYRFIDLVVEGIDESKSMLIVSSKPSEISQALMSTTNTGVTILKGMGGYSREDRDIVYVIVRRLEVNKIKDIVTNIDQQAFITVQNVHEVIGKNIRRKE